MPPAMPAPAAGVASGASANPAGRLRRPAGFGRPGAVGPVHCGLGPGSGAPEPPGPAAGITA